MYMYMYIFFYFFKPHHLSVVYDLWIVVGICPELLLHGVRSKHQFEFSRRDIQGHKIFQIFQCVEYFKEACMKYEMR